MLLIYLFFTRVNLKDNVSGFPSNKKRKIGLKYDSSKLVNGVSYKSFIFTPLVLVLRKRGKLLLLRRERNLNVHKKHVYTGKTNKTD